MKKLTAIILAIMMAFSISSQVMAREDTVVIPDYEIIIDNASIYYNDSIYPFLNYKGITYFPMTYEYARAMNLTTGWLVGVALMVAYNPCDEALPIYETTTNKKYNSAVIPTGYNIYVNGKKVDNSKAEYPLLNFRGVTYFPITWEYAVENFGWQLSFENNIFKIDTVNNTADRWTLIEKRENDAVLSFYYGKEIPGSNKHDYITEYYSLDYATGDLTLLEDYIEGEYKAPNSSAVEVTVEDGYAYYNGQKLEGIYIKEATNDYDIPDSGYDINAYATDAHLPLDVINVRVNTYSYGNVTSLGKKENTYINVNGKLIGIGDYKTIENVYELNGNIYFNTVDYAQTIFRHYLRNKRMWKLSADGNLTEIKYADHNSMEIIGKANGKLYLKCLWAPENSIEDAPYSVSLINDGYYTFNGEGIRFISPYIYSDFDIVTPYGDIMAVNNKLDKITKCEINPEYY